MAKEIRVPHPAIEYNPRTSTSAPALAGATSLTVENGTVFSDGQFLLMRSFGNKQSEIVRIANSTPGATSITLNASNPLVFDHPANSSVTYIPYNQVAIEYSTDFATLFESGLYETVADAADAATWSALTTVNITPSNGDGTFYYDGAIGNTRSYRSRFYNSANNTYSGYSDAVLPDGYEHNTAQSIIDRALGRMHKKIGGNITSEFLYGEFVNCQEYVQSKRKRWSFNQAYRNTLAEIAPGKNYYVLPSAIDIRETKRAMLHVWINDGAELDYIDMEQFNISMKDVHVSPSTTTLTSLSGTLQLEDTSDFADEGTLIVITDETRDEITYTANNRTTNTLTLDSPNGATTTHAIGTQFWQNAEFGTPTRYTIYGGYIWFDKVPDATLYKRTIKCDFYRKIVPINSPNDYIVFPDPQVVFNYLCFAIADRLEKENEAIKYKAFVDDALGEMIVNETDGQKRKFIMVVPRVNRVIGRRTRMPR